MADVSKLYEKAEQSTQRRAYDLAADYYQQILVLDPDAEKARLALREVELRRLDEMGGPSPLMASLASLPNFVMAFSYGLAKKGELAAAEYEKILSRNPRNAAVSFKLGSTLEKTGHLRSALAVYRGITLWDEGNVKAYLAAGGAARALNRVEEALGYYEEAKRLNPKEKVATDAVRDLSAMISLKPREEASSFRDLIKKPGAQAGGSGAAAEAGQDVEALQARFDEDPSDPDTASALLDALEASNRRKEFREALKTAVKAQPRNLALHIRLQDSNVSALERKLAQIRQLGEGGDPAEEKALEAKLRSARVSLLQARVELEPNRADYHLELGMLQFESGRVDDAIANFQQAKKDPKKMRDAAFWLGRSFLEKGRHNLAVNQLESAFEAGSVLDLRGKETLYFLGAAKRAAGDLEGAKAHFERIYEEDIHFRDVARILEEWA